MDQYPIENAPRKKWTGWAVGCAVGGVLILCLVGFALVGGFAWMLTLFGTPSDGLSVEVSTPSSAVAVGEVYQIEVEISNQGAKNLTVTEIQLPNNLLADSQLIGVEPAGNQGPDNENYTVYNFEMIIAPSGSETVVFSLQAINPISVSGEIRVKAENTVVSTPVRVIISPAVIEVIEPTPTNTVLAADVIPYRAVVQIVAMIDLNGQRVDGWTGSGTIISEDGLILTNAHVVLSDRFYDVVDLIVLITTAQDQPPEPLFFADVIQADIGLDIAVIKIRSDLNGGPANFSALGIQPVRIGRADVLQLGDPITILGYPGIGGDTITLTRGEVSGFTFEAPYGNRAFIKTSATIAGGNSGGLAANAQGEIIGIPSQVGSGDLEGLIVDCRPLADTNRDGVIDQRDNCVPTGGFINALRPVDLAQTLIEAALAGQVAIQEDQEPEEHQEYEHEGEVVLYDDFSDNRHDWYVGEYNEGSVDIVGGQLEINVDVAKTYIFTHLPDVYSDVILAVDGRVLQPTGDGDFGFVCGYVDDQNYTVLEISEDGYYAIWALINDELRYLEEWSPSDLIPSSGPITLAAYCGADGFALAVNDTLLVDVDASHYRPGRVGLFTGTWNQANIRVGFDEFWILTP